MKGDFLPVATVLDCVTDGLRCTRVECLGRRPTVRVADVAVGRVGSVAVLVDKIPELLRCKVKHLGSSAVAGTDGRLIKVSELSIAGLVEVGETHIDHVVARRHGGAGEDMIFAVVEDNRRIFDAFDVPPIVLWANQWTARVPNEGVLYVGRSLSRSGYAEWREHGYERRQGKIQRTHFVLSMMGTNVGGRQLESWGGMSFISHTTSEIMSGYEWYHNIAGDIIW